MAPGKKSLLKIEAGKRLLKRKPKQRANDEKLATRKEGLRGLWAKGKLGVARMVALVFSIKNGVS